MAQSKTYLAYATSLEKRKNQLNVFNAYHCQISSSTVYGAKGPLRDCSEQANK